MIRNFATSPRFAGDEIEMEDAAVEVVVMAAGVVGAAATLPFMMPRLDGFFSW